MLISESRQRELDRYLRYVVRRLPRWAKSLFRDNSASFVIDPEGNIALWVAEDISLRVKNNITFVVQKVLEKHPSSLIDLSKEANGEVLN